MKTKILVLVLVFACLCFALLSCGETSNSTTQSSNTEISSGNTTDNSVNNTTESSNTNEHIHSYGEWELVKEPGCTEKGIKVQNCSCGDVKANYIEALGHKTETVKGYDSTCSINGLTDGKKCTVCEEILLEQEVIELKPHTEEAVKGYEATCTETGLTDGKKCAICKETIVEQKEIELKPHTEETVKGYEATCTAKGLTDGKKCAICKETLLEQEEISFQKHIYENLKCTVCGADWSSDGLEYTLSEDGTYYILTGKGTCEDTDIVIASVYGNLPVKSIGSKAFSNCTTIGSVEIPYGITSISDGAFIGSSITSVKIPNSVTSIGSHAFNACSSLTKVVIPNSVTTIDWLAFYGYALEIYCEADSQPSGWDNGWNPGNRPVVWGYIAEE